MQRLGRNLGGYHGERIDIEAVSRDFAALGQERGWQIDELPLETGSALIALRRPVATARRAIYISAGIHGDEPAGPLAIRELLHGNRWPADAHLWVCPCLNPWGFAHNARFNREGIDLNRDYRHLQSAEVRSHVTWLRRQPRFDLTLCLHEDWEAHGFYVYELRTEDRTTLASQVVAAAAQIGPVDLSTEIDGRPARDGVIFPSLDIDARPLWPEALYLFRHHASQCLTLEAPSDFPLASRVAVLTAGVQAVLG